MWRNLYEALQKLQRFVIMKYPMNMMKRQDYCVSVLNRMIRFEYVFPYLKRKSAPIIRRCIHVDIFQYLP
jgi:hypothetical protein